MSPTEQLWTNPRSPVMPVSTIERRIVRSTCSNAVPLHVLAEWDRTVPFMTSRCYQTGLATSENHNKLTQETLWAATRRWYGDAARISNYDRMLRCSNWTKSFKHSPPGPPTLDDDHEIVAETQKVIDEYNEEFEPGMIIDHAEIPLRPKAPKTGKATKEKRKKSSAVATKKRQTCMHVRREIGVEQSLYEGILEGEVATKEAARRESAEE